MLSKGAKAVLMKGGHAKGDESIDYFLRGDSVIPFKAPRIETQNMHGTGCTLSSAITAGLAKGMTLEASIETAKIYITHAIKAANLLHIGSGKGPVHHFYKVCFAPQF